MNSTSIITLIIVLLALVIAAAVMAPMFMSRKRSKGLRSQFGTEYAYTLQAQGDEKKAQDELEERQKHVESLEIRSLTARERERYHDDWVEIQAKFVDKPGMAVVDADHLIMEVMQMRAYPVSDFEQRAADVSVSYPSLVGNYRAAREIALKNEQHQASTEELRQAMIYYRSLFDELLEAQITVP